MADIPKRGEKKRATNLPNMHDVARLAGVSQMTVSRVMRGKGYVSDDVFKQVKEAARKIGYVHNRLVGGNLGYENPLVGIVVPTLQNRVFTEVLSGISDTLGSHGLRPVFGISEYSLLTEEELVFDFLSWRPSGLILPGLEHNQNVRHIIKQTGVKTAEFMDVDGEPMSGCFGISHKEVGTAMARFLLDRGYRSFSYVSSQGQNDLRAAKRFGAFASVIKEAGGRIVSEETSSDPSSMNLGRALTAKLLSHSDRPEVIYYSNDDLAAGGLMHCLANDLSLPEDIAIAGFNGLSFLQSLPLRITTTQTPRYEIGVAAANWVAGNQNDNEISAKQGLKCELLVGDTT